MNDLAPKDPNMEGSSKLSPWRSRLWMIPPALLAAIAIVQFIAVQSLKLDRWEGGGFGMFASVDRENLRSTRLIVPTEKGELPAFLAHWSRDLTRILTLPNTGLLGNEASQQKNTEWTSLIWQESGGFGSKLHANSKDQVNLAKVYSSGAGSGNLDFDRYPRILVPIAVVKNDSSAIIGIGSPRLEVYRLVYHGQGRFGSKLLNVSNGK